MVKDKEANDQDKIEEEKAPYLFPKVPDDQEEVGRYQPPNETTDYLDNVKDDEGSDDVGNVKDEIDGREDDPGHQQALVGLDRVAGLYTLGTES